MKKTSYYQINSIVKAFDLIEILVTETEIGLSELCRRLKLPKTSIHRMLLTLQSLGYVKQNPSNPHYMASIKFFELGQKVVQNLRLTDIARPYMIKLSEKTGETINLGVLYGLDVVCIDKVGSRHALRQDQSIGARNKAYCTSFGKAILAFLPEEEWTDLISQEQIVILTAKSLKTVEAIEENLKVIREKGYAVDDEEGAIGVRCVGAPIFDHEDRVIAGISIAGPALRVIEKDILGLADMIKETSTSISEKLGHHAD